MDSWLSDGHLAGFASAFTLLLGKMNASENYQTTID